MTEPDGPAPGPGPRRDVVFVHIPKTAGTSLRLVLARRPQGRTVLLDYGPARETSEAIRALQGPPARHGRLREAVPAPGGHLLMGHFPACRYRPLFNADSFVSFVRDPVARAVSDWNHHVTHRGITQPLLAFAARPQRRDTMTRMLGPEWRRFGFLGLTERYGECLPALAAHLGAGHVAEERANLGLYPDSMPAGRVDAETAAAIAALNPGDAALYAEVRARWDAAGRWTPDPPPAVPRLEARPARRDGGRTWRGWCADPDGLRTWVVAARHAAREVAQIWADGHAPRLAARGAVRTGVGQFAFDPAAAGLPAGAVVEFVAVDAPAAAYARRRRRRQERDIPAQGIASGGCGPANDAAPDRRPATPASA